MDILGNVMNAIVCVQKLFVLTPFTVAASRETTDKFFGPYMLAQVAEICEREINVVPEIEVHSFSPANSERYFIHLDFKEAEDDLLSKIEVILRVFPIDISGDSSAELGDVVTLHLMPEIKIKHAAINDYHGDSFNINVDIYKGEIPERKEISEETRRFFRLFEFTQCDAELVATNIEQPECVNESNEE